MHTSEVKRVSSNLLDGKHKHVFERLPAASGISLASLRDERRSRKHQSTARLYIGSDQRLMRMQTD
jgi:hypothetical protein